ncbi:MAG TPA: glycosyltransferase family 39 protein, partial [Candidatus Edwardsbacteria bacterium]|nr:glycosyltransferase family 39 protein [Candidatus Edwardsbacteria bacterium]
MSAQPAQAPRSGWTETVFTAGWRPYAWICGIGLLLYARVLSFGYTSLDDIHLIVSNRALLGDWHNVGRAFASDVFWKSPGAYYRPLLTLSLMADRLWGGIDPRAYHLGNIVLHLACAALVLRLLRALGTGPLAALLLALAFTVHPALTQAVAWIPGRNDMLMAAGALLAVLALLRFIAAGGWRWYWAHLGCVALGLLAKETFLLFPVLMLAYLLAVRRERWRAPSTLALVAAWLALILLYLVLRHRVVGAGAGLGHYLSADGGAVAIGMLSYLGKAMLPLGLSVLPVPADVRIGYGLAALALLVVVWCWRGAADRRTLRFGLAWFVALLLPAAFFNTGHVSFLEHRLYLPLAGLAVALGQIRVPGPRWRGMAAAAAMLVVAAFGGMAFAHCGVFRDTASFWQSAVESS